MNYSRRQLYAMGEPLGECVTRKEGGRVIYGSGGGGSTQTQVTDLPDWAKPTAQRLLGTTESTVFTKDPKTNEITGFQPYQQYTGQRTAQFTPLQQQAYGNAYNLNAGPEGFSSQVGSYMSPYMQNVVDREKLAAYRDSQLLGQQQQAQATQAGAFGGYREGIQRAERERGLRSQLQDIQAKGTQAAYDRAADQFRQGITQQMAVGQQQQQFGTQQQQTVQQMLDQQYQDFLNQRRYPYQQLEFMSNILRGTPMGAASTLYASPGSSLGQVAGLGAGIAGALFRAEGGEVSSYADGGVTDVNNIRSIVSKLSDQQLQEAQKAAAARGDAEEMQVIAAEIAQRASMRRGVGAGVTDEFADQMEESMASGGIVAFAGGGTDYGDPMGTGAAEISETPRTGTESTALGRWIQRYFETPQYEIEAREAKETAQKEQATQATAKARKAVADALNQTPAAKEEPKPKAAKEVTKAVQQVAKAAGVPETSLTDEAMSLYNKMQGLRKPDIDKLNALVEAQKGRAEEIKGRGLSDALMNFGFTMAAEASKPGARFLASASKAAPVISKTMAENQQAVQAAQDAFNKAQIEQLRSEVAGGGENMRTALSTAQNIMRDRLEEKKLAELADYHRQHIAATVGARGPTITQLAQRIMADPTFKGTERDALREAAGLATGADIRAESAAQLKYGQDVAKAEKAMSMFMAAAKTPQEKAALQAELNRTKASLAQAYGLTPSAGGGGGVDYSQWGAVTKVTP